jgi:peptidoglycan/LPS O-acetylase OafA/YrhL
MAVRPPHSLNLEARMKKVLTLTALILTVPAIALAAGAAVAPEIDGGTAIAALTLLGGAALVLRGRRRK